MNIMIIPETIITFDTAAGNAGECRIRGLKLGLGLQKYRRFPGTARHISLRVEIHYYQPATIIGQIGNDFARAHRALSIVDVVISLVGIPVSVDTWGADAVYGSSPAMPSHAHPASPL